MGKTGGGRGEGRGGDVRGIDWRLIEVGMLGTEFKRDINHCAIGIRIGIGIGIEDFNAGNYFFLKRIQNRNCRSLHTLQLNYTYTTF